MDNLIDTIALNCNDSNFNDFPKHIYLEKLLRVDRMLAKSYGVLRKTLTFYVKEYLSETNINDDIILNIPEFNAEFLVSVNDITLEKASHELKNVNTYYLEYRGDRNKRELLFNYIKEPGLDLDLSISEEQSDPDLYGGASTYKVNYSKGLEDEITICYTFIPEMDREDTNVSRGYRYYLLPDKYDEERIAKTCVEIARLGIVKYAGQEKKRQYQEIFELYSDRMNEYDKRNVPNDAFVSIKPFTLI